MLKKSKLQKSRLPTSIHAMVPPTLRIYPSVHTLCSEFGFNNTRCVSHLIRPLSSLAVKQKKKIRIGFLVAFTYGSAK